MARPHRKLPDELMNEAYWSRRDICRLFRKSPTIIDRYINHPDSKKRLPGLQVNGEFMAAKADVLCYFRYVPYGAEG